MKLSIIVPVYNGEEYIEECLKSIINQTISDIEIVVVNDGSSDSTVKIVESLKENDKRIKLINQKNNGVSSARNNGIINVKGDYIGFVDGDDKVEPSYFEELYNIITSNKCDISFTTMSTIVNGVKQMNSQEFQSYKVLEREYILNIIIPFLLVSNEFNAVYTKVFSRELIIDNNILFDETMALGEDGDFCIRAFNVATKVIQKPDLGYYYREVVGSATRTERVEKYLEDIKNSHDRKIPIDVTPYHSMIKLWKAKKSTVGIIQLIHMVLDNGLIDYSDKKKYIKRIINDKFVSDIVKILVKNSLSDYNRFERILILFIRIRSTAFIFLIKAYTKFRENQYET